MKCENCGANLPDNLIRCKYCNHILQMVPDYNPLDDVVEEQVRSSIDGEELPEQYISHNRGQNNRGNNRAATRTSGNRTKENREAENRKRREQERRMAAMKKKRSILIVSIVSVLLILSIIIYMIYSNSYAGQIGKAEAELSKNNVKQAIEYYDIAIAKNTSKLDAYEGKSMACILGGDMDLAEEVLIEAANENPESITINRAVIDFYMEYDELEKIDPFLRSLTNDTVKNDLKTYYSSVPEFSLEEGVYDDVQELTITTAEHELHYTIDGTPATLDSPRYTSPIQIEVGTTVVKAISVNAQGIPSKEVSKEYIVELPIEMAPIVSPSTGQYKEATKITIQVPSGYTAYYTLDNTMPTANSNVYLNPIDMPEGNTIFTAVLIHNNGKSSDVTKRNYDLTIEKKEGEE